MREALRNFERSLPLGAQPRHDPLAIAIGAHIGGAAAMVDAGVEIIGFEHHHDDAVGRLPYGREVAELLEFARLPPARVHTRPQFTRLRLLVDAYRARRIAERAVARGTVLAQHRSEASRVGQGGV